MTKACRDRKSVIDQNQRSCKRGLRSSSAILATLKVFLIDIDIDKLHVLRPVGYLQQYMRRPVSID